MNETIIMLKNKFIKYLYNIRHQYTLRNIKEDLRDKETILNVDFSKDYNVKLVEKNANYAFWWQSASDLAPHSCSLHKKIKRTHFVQYQITQTWSLSYLGTYETSFNSFVTGKSETHDITFCKRRTKHPIQK